MRKSANTHPNTRRLGQLLISNITHYIVSISVISIDVVFLLNIIKKEGTVLPGAATAAPPAREAEAAEEAMTKEGLFLVRCY